MSSIEDLVGVKWSDLDCYGLVREGLRRLFDREIPERPAELLRVRDELAVQVSAGEASRLGDVVQYDGRQGPGRRLGLALDPFRVLTTSSFAGESFIARAADLRPIARFRLREVGG